MPTALSGGWVVRGRRPSADGLAAAITRPRVTTVWAGSPAWVQQLVDVVLADPDGVDLHSLEVAMFSSRTMSPLLGDQLRQVCGPPVRMLEVFGQPESTSSLRFWPDRVPEKHQHR